MPEKTEIIQNILKNLPASKLEGLKRLFWEELNYDHANQPISTRGWDAPLADALAEHPVLFATAGTGDAFHILYTRLMTEKMSISTERALIHKLISEHPHSLFVFSNLSQTHWHFVNAVYEKDERAQRRRVLRRISVSSQDRLRTASERIARLDADSADKDLFGLDPAKLQHLHEQAFDVEAVTEEFFEDYKQVFNMLTVELKSQSQDKVWAHDFALQFMNRLMFLYYIERKGWLGNDPDFLHNFWRAYRQSQQPNDTFVSHWVKLLFFNAFNKPLAPAVASASYLPQNYRDALQLAPWLNGGLFAENNLDTLHGYVINDKLITEVFNFLDRYNFTISEDTPLDQEVAVDPEMIGKVYESLVNVSSEADDRGDAGIFYTPRIEIDLMCRLSLVDWLANHLSDISKSVLYEFVFAFSPQDKTAADRQLTDLNLWPVMDRLLRSVTVLDPACGSGSFLVGMLMILDDLLSRCASALGGVETPYERRKGIVASSLYGVDIMEWAVHVAELRLWLQLVIDTEIDENELRLRPLLPNLSFKVRKGDSLVQEIGGLSFSLKRTGGQLRRDLEGKITALKTDKLDYFNNKTPRKYQNKDQVEQAERLLFREIIEEELQAKRKRKQELTQALSPASNLFGEVQQTQISIDSVSKQRELDQVIESISKLEPALAALKDPKDIPFVWDVAFVEIFESERGGFDIVVGNPPYIRQEKIRDPGLLTEDVTNENKKAYKTKLARAVYATYPKTFGYNPAEDTVNWSLNMRSDYYVYFFFICLSLINRNGSFCFITSNSWLDAEYGKSFQQFLITRCKVKMIIDNQKKRSFRNAAINSIISLFAYPKDQVTDDPQLRNHEARFVLFKVPFENGLSPILWEEVEEVKDRRVTTEFRTLVISQERLLTNGFEHTTKTYVGDKWGGKYLRAPDLFIRILREYSENLIQLKDYCEIKGYIHDNNTGEKYSKVRFLKSIKNLESIQTKNDAIGVIDYGVKEIGESRIISPILFPRTYNDRHLVFYNLGKLYGKEFYKILTPPESTLSIVLQLNSTFGILQRELWGLVNLGEGGIKFNSYDVEKFYIIKNLSFDSITESVDHFLNRRILPTKEELREADRRTIDRLIFNFFQLTDDEISEIYKTTLELVEKRLEKAGKTNEI